ncbi:MAG: hypothetical protein QNL24_11925 [Akkermansiaceae bacterium]
MTTPILVSGFLLANAGATTVTLDSLDRSIMVGSTDTVSTTAPTAPGDGWFSGTDVAGTIRGRQSTQVELRT